MHWAEHRMNKKYFKRISTNEKIIKAEFLSFHENIYQLKEVSKIIMKGLNFREWIFWPIRAELCSSVWLETIRLDRFLFYVFLVFLLFRNFIFPFLSSVGDCVLFLFDATFSFPSSNSKYVHCEKSIINDNLTYVCHSSTNNHGQNSLQFSTKRRIMLMYEAKAYFHRRA